MTPSPVQSGHAPGIGGEQRRIDRVGLGEGLAHIIENAGIGRRVGPPRAAARNCTSGSTVSSPAGHSGPPRPSRAP
jgi:hypothetical protein